MNIQSAYIDYYVGSYGKTIRIAVKNKPWVTSFRDNIIKIFMNENDRLDICKLDDTECSETINELMLIRVSEGTTPCMVLNSKKDPMRFRWIQDKEGIETLLCLIDSLIDRDSPCHQYLAHEEDGCIIELSYNE